MPRAVNDSKKFTNESKLIVIKIPKKRPEIIPIEITRIP